MNDQELQIYAKNYGIIIDENQSKQLLLLMKLVLEYNQKTNLTAIKNELNFIDKHLIDSLLCQIEDDTKSLKILDVGTGGGFPGIPLAIKYPQHQFTLLDSTAKKIEIVSDIAKQIGLNNVDCMSGRAEEIGRDQGYRELFDVVVSRGVAEYAVLLELCTPFIKEKGLFYSWKGPKYQDEILSAKSAIQQLKMKITQTKSELLLKSDEVHVIIRAEKMDHTPEKYPRNYGTIKKRPL